ncbi:MAG: nicotinate-nucleotide--dimethylbenzimidazole phosphoribosyltransferase, partial [Actinomycetota bacterium]|nr:nicotinate-nucleotide--dimethylbenzimidazole phosphoribosyltransferase [Actinomycetota bacterium]
AADALGMPDVVRLLRRGRELGRTAATEGVVALGEAGIGNTTVAAALAAVLLDRPPEEMAGLGAGADTAMVERKREVLLRAVSRARAEHGKGLSDPRRLLSALGGPEICVLVGVVLGAAEARSVVVLDGLATTVAALLAVLLEPGASACLVAGQRSRETAHAAVLARLGLEPLLDLRIRSGEGAGAALAAGLLLAGLRVRRETGRTERPTSS